MFTLGFIGGNPFYWPPVYVAYVRFCRNGLGTFDLALLLLLSASTRGKYCRWCRINSPQTCSIYTTSGEQRPDRDEKGTGLGFNTQLIGHSRGKLCQVRKTRSFVSQTTTTADIYMDHYYELSNIPEVARFHWRTTRTKCHLILPLPYTCLL